MEQLFLKQEQHRLHHQGHAVVPPQPAPRLIVTHAGFAFPILAGALNSIAVHALSDHFAGGQDGFREKISPSNLLEWDVSVPIE